MNRLRCLLIGAQPHAWTTISLACLKAAADADPVLRGRAEVEILNLVAPTRERVIEEVVRRRPDVIGFSCYLWNSGVFLPALKAVREALPGAMIVLGGPDVYPQAREVLEAHPEVDVVVLGEAEIVFPRLLAARLDGGSWRELPGMAYIRDGAFFQNPEAAPIADLDSLPSPILSGALTLPEDTTRVTLETSRGCPFDCSFCDWPGRGRKPRTRSVDRVIAELEYVVARAKNLFIVQFADSDIFLDKSRAKELLERARELLAGSSVILYMELYLGRLDEELMRAVDFPNALLSAGVQTATPEALKTMNRFFHREKIAEVVRGLRVRAPTTRLSLEIIYPLPGDTYDGFLDTYEWTLSLRPEIIGAYPALVLPGADMGRHPERYEMEYTKTPPRRVVALPRFSGAEVRRANAKVFYVSALQRLPFVRNTLAHLPGEGAAKRPLLALYEEYSALLVRDGFLPRLEEVEHLEDAFASGSNHGNSLMRDGAKLDRAMARLRAFAATVLETGGRAGRLPVFEHYWRVESEFLRWIDLVRTSDAGLGSRFDADAGAAGRLLWVGLETLTDESPLTGRARGEAEIVHVVAPGNRPHHCLRKVRHVRDLAGLGGREGGDRRADAVFLSHLFSRSSPAERESLLSYAERAAGPGGRLVLWDGMLGPSPLESLRHKTDADWERPAADWSAAAVEEELAARGWSLESAPDRLADSYRFRFKRS